MQVTDAIAGRRSVRAYKDDPVADDVLRRLVDAAVLAPNAVNQQPWTFTIITDAQLLTRISDESKAHMLATAGEGREAEHFRAHLVDPAFHIFYKAPALVVISAKAAGAWIVEDCALAAENLMLTAHAEGLGTCWIGFAQSYLGTVAGKSMIAAHATQVPVAPIIVGWPQTAPSPVPRNKPEIRWIR